MEQAGWEKKIKDCVAAYKNLFAVYVPEIPEKGLLAGMHQPVMKYHLQGNSEIWRIFEADNMHYPMGDACLRYGVSGILEMTGENPKDTWEQSAYRRGIHEIYGEV